jgi:hypothetical protein
VAGHCISGVQIEGLQESHFMSIATFYFSFRNISLWTFNIAIVKRYSVVNTTEYSVIASSYSIDDKLQVSAIWWPSSGFIQVFEEKVCYFYISFGSEISDRPSCWNGINKSMVVFPSLYYTNCENFWGNLTTKSKELQN